MKRLLALLLAMMLLTPSALAEEEDRLTISFVGDCSIGDAIQYRDYATSYHSLLKEKGYDWPFSLVKPYLDADDCTVANLEVVLTNLTRVRQKKDMNLIGDPAHTGVLLASGIDIVCTANNHAWDFRADGYHDALSHLDEAGIPHFGTLYPGTADGSDITPILEVKGVKIGFVGFSYPQEYDKKRIASRISKLREEGAQIVICSLHWGTEEKARPNAGQYSFAKACIDAGADVLYGHHAHVLQTVTFYKGKPIFFSTGNFTFGTMSNVDPATGIFQLTWDLSSGEPKLDTFTMIPCETRGAGDYRPTPLTDEAKRRAVFKKLQNPARKDMETVSEKFLETGTMKVPQP